MVSTPLGLVAALLVALAGAGAGEIRAAHDPVKAALSQGAYPWYDAPADAAKPSWPSEEPEFGALDRLFRGLNRWKIPGIGTLGDLIVYGLVLLALSVLAAFLLELWRRFRPTPLEGDDVRDARAAGVAARREELPAGLRPETLDPWAEALARRARGDYAGAVVCLFAHQLLTLDRLRQIRLAPGRTGRQLVRSIDDRKVRAWVAPALALFESVYYGRQTPSAEAFEAVWADAEAFERHRAGEGRA